MSIKARARTLPSNRSHEPQGRAWLEGEGSNQRLMLYGIVGDEWDGFTSDEVVQMLAGLQQDKLTVHLNTPGGFVWEGIAIANHLSAHRAEVSIVIDGLAASMGSFIAMSGDVVRMHRSAMLMIHNPWTVSAGEADDLRKDADMLDKVRDALLTAYMDKSGKSRDEIIDIMNAETWLTAEEAVAEGFADDIIEDAGDVQDRIAALDLSLINMEHAPQAIRRLAHQAKGRTTARPQPKPTGTNGGNPMKPTGVLAAIITALTAQFDKMATDDTRDELQKQMAEISGLSVEDVQAVLKGEKSDFSTEQLNNMAFVLDTDVATLMGAQPAEPPKPKSKQNPDDPVAAFCAAATAKKFAGDVAESTMREDPEAVLEKITSAAMEKGAAKREEDVMARAKEIKAMCRQANRPEKAMELFLEGLSPAEARERLFAELASQQRVDNSLSPDDLGGGRQPAIDTRAIYEKRRKAS